MCIDDFHTRVDTIQQQLIDEECCPCCMHFRGEEHKMSCESRSLRSLLENKEPPMRIVERLVVQVPRLMSDPHVGRNI